MSTALTLLALISLLVLVGVIFENNEKRHKKSKAKAAGIPIPIRIPVHVFSHPAEALGHYAGPVAKERVSSRKWHVIKSDGSIVIVHNDHHHIDDVWNRLN